MFESRYSKVLTIILIVVIVAIVTLLGFLAFDYIKKYNTTKQASDFVENYQGDISTGNTTSNDNNEGNENVELNDINEISIGSGGSSNSTSAKKKYKGFTVVGTMKIPTINLEYPIVEEVTTTSLNTALTFLYPSPDNLNMPGNSVIIGQDYRGTSLTYEVYNKFEAHEADTSFYQRDTNGLAELTLSTCTDASNDQRTIIFAKQI